MKRQISEAFTVLGIEPTTDSEAIKLAYKKAASLSHPDKDGGSNDSFHLVNSAYKLVTRFLSEPVKCKTCSGSGSITAGLLKIRCKKCKGSGKIG